MVRARYPAVRRELLDVGCGNGILWADLFGSKSLASTVII
jgi:2-polyprenyl-3-methyl-5-hydroxy-6-metoxy-1,4-benzoquinol methylase